MAELEKYTPAEAIEEEKNLKTVEVYITVPGLEVTRKIPVVGTAELKKNCTVTEKPFKKDSVEIIAVVEKKDGSKNGYRYALPKLPGEIIPDKCSIKFDDGLVTAVMKKAEPEPPEQVQSWDIYIKKGLRNL